MSERPPTSTGVRRHLAWENRAVIHAADPPVEAMMTVSSRDGTHLETFFHRPPTIRLKLLRQRRRVYAHQV